MKNAKINFPYFVKYIDYFYTETNILELFSIANIFGQNVLTMKPFIAKRMLDQRLGYKFL